LAAFPACNAMMPNTSFTSYLHALETRVYKRSKEL
jgi:hypothetical protein